MFTNKYKIVQMKDGGYLTCVGRWWLPFYYGIGWERKLDDAKQLIPLHRKGFVVYEE